MSASKEIVYVITTVSIIFAVIMTFVIIIIARNNKKMRFESKMKAEAYNNEEKGKKAIVRHLHDAVGQKLIVVKNSLESAIMCLPPEGDNNLTLLKMLKTALDSVYFAEDEIRVIESSLRPQVLDVLGFSSAIKESFLRLDNFETSFEIDPLVDSFLPGPKDIHLFRVMAECFANIIKHSIANNIVVSISLEGERIKALIKDDGIGFDVNAKSHGYGLLSIRERVEKCLDGELLITSSPGETKINLEIPI